jgi:hypothetical protein
MKMSLYLDEIKPELAAVLEGTTNKVRVGGLGPGVQAGARKVHDGRDTIRLDRLAGKILRALEICSGISIKQWDVRVRKRTLDVDNGTTHPARLARSPEDMTISEIPFNTRFG